LKPAVALRDKIDPNMRPSALLLWCCVVLPSGNRLQAVPIECIPPSITLEPANQMVDAGTTVQFHVAASGTAPLSYQWLWNDVDLPGQTNIVLELPDPQLATGDYTVVVTNDCGAITSHVARLTVYVPVLFSALTSRWRFNQWGVDLGTAWKEVGFDDSSWPESEALFYSEAAPGSLPERTLLAVTNEAGQPINTYYFRQHFSFGGGPGGLWLLATNYVQNGAIFYLNGVELGRLRIAGGMIAAGSPGFEGPSGQADLLLFPASALVPGDNVVAVEVHRQSAGGTNAGALFGMALRTTSRPPPMPDLIVWPPLKPHIELCSFTSNNCEVVEGCAMAGTRRLLRFDIQTRNIGTADLVLGDPSRNPLFVAALCHNHYHFDGYTALRLANSNGVVAVGQKIGFALEDVYRWDTTNAALEYVYFDGFQGIQRGWADIYDYWIPCQYIDITETPPGLYTLELEVDPDHKLAELNETNNITRIPVEIPANWAPCNTPALNDNFADAQVVPYTAATVVGNSECATLERGEPALTNDFGTQSAFSVWFRWTAPSNGNVTLDTDGSNFPPMVALYAGTNLADLTMIAQDIAFAGFPQPIVANVTAGTTYSIVVDGYYDISWGTNAVAGEVVLNINANANDLFAAALPLTDRANTITGTTRAATKEPGEPDHAGNPGGRSIWYSWIAPFTGEMTVDTSGSRFHTLLAIYTGTRVDELTPVSSDADPGATGASRVLFNAVAGATYRIAVDGRDGESGLSTLNWRPALHLLSPVLAGSMFQFTLTGLIGDRCLIETSCDFLTWAPWRYLTNASAALPVVDSLRTGQNFYRVRTD
jgi:hypothetical protein